MKMIVLALDKQMIKPQWMEDRNGNRIHDHFRIYIKMINKDVKGKSMKNKNPSYFTGRNKSKEKKVWSILRKEIRVKKRERERDTACSKKIQNKHGKNI